MRPDRPPAPGVIAMGPQRRRAGRALLIGAAVLVMVVVLVGVLLVYESMELFVPGSLNVAAPASPCESLLIVGLRGNGDGVNAESFNGLGGDTHGVVTHLTSKLGAVPSQVVAFLYDTGVAQQIGGHMESGARALVTWLDGRGRQCPSERWILIGQSEGAGVLHLSAPRLSQRVAAVVLLADPIRVAESAYDVGVTRTNGLLARFVLGSATGGVRDNVAPALVSRFWSYCLVDDPVCDTALSDFTVGIVKKLTGSDVHTSYRNHADVLELGAQFAASGALSSAKVPLPARESLTSVPGHR
jgi:hypothetical protein